MCSDQNSTPPKPPQVKPPPPAPETPDEDTKKSPDFTRPGDQGGRVFYFERWGIKYGTDDKGHAASIILSLTLLALMALLFCIGAIAERSWVGDAVKILGTAFTLTAGIAIGKGSSGNSK